MRPLAGKSLRQTWTVVNAGEPGTTSRHWHPDYRDPGNPTAPNLFHKIFETPFGSDAEIVVVMLGRDDERTDPYISRGILLDTHNNYEYQAAGYYAATYGTLENISAGVTFSTKGSKRASKDLFDVVVHGMVKIEFAVFAGQAGAGNPKAADTSPDSKG
ncbi:hypothetical protein HDU93_003597 [Gonapodya sp. JEL0774]|nr:hypothetical protein HDU93_003597 [Gonapodya sp. JEL0774]